MFRNRSGLLFVLLFSLVVSLVATTFVTVAQEPSPTGEVVTLAPTEYVITAVVEPTAQVTAAPVDDGSQPPLETAEPPGNPRGGMTASEVWELVQEFVKPILGYAGLIILALFGATLFLAYNHLPAWARALVAGGGQSVIDKFKEDAKQTPTTDDDELWMRFDAAFNEWLKGKDKQIERLIASRSGGSLNMAPLNLPDKPLSDFFPPTPPDPGQG